MNQGEIKYCYGWVENLRAWLINYMDDAGLCRNMEALNVRIQTSGSKRYWVIRDKNALDAVKPVLDGLGYEEYGREKKDPAQPASAAEAHFVAKPFDISANAPASGVHTYSVSEIGKNISDLFKNTFTDEIWLRGEVSGLGNRGESVKSHLYFDLVEVRNAATYKIQAVIWLGEWKNIFAMISSGEIPELRDGVEIRVFGKPSYYAKGGKVSFHIAQIDPYFAQGEFLRQKIEIYNRLAAKGIHERNKNLPMPELPLRLALFSNTGAAGFGDLKRKLESRGFPYRVTLFTVALQGREVEPSFRKAFAALESMGVDNFDLGIIVRGGGSVTDLAAFNNEWIAEKIALCPLKFFVGIGHDRDYTVLDEIVTRMITPTAVGDTLNEILEGQVDALDRLSSDIRETLRTRIADERKKLSRQAFQCAAYARDAYHCAVLEIDGLRHDVDKKVSARLADARSGLENIRMQTIHLYRRQMSVEENKLADFRRDLGYQCGMRFRNENDRLAGTVSGLSCAAERILQAARQVLDNAKIVVETTDPRHLFALGYVMISDVQGKLLKSANAVQCGQQIAVRMADGRLTAVVSGIETDGQGDKNGTEKNG